MTLPYILWKINKEILVFGDSRTNKRKLHYPKNSILIDDIYVDKILISNKVFFVDKGYKYFIGCEDEDYKTKSFVKEEKINGYTIDHLEISSDDSDEEASDESDKEFLDEFDE